MTNTVPAVFHSATASMTSRSSILSPRRSSSWAAVVAGQARPPPVTTDSSDYRAATTYPGQQQQFRSSVFGQTDSQQMPPPATVPSYLAHSLYAERLAARNASVFNSQPSTPLSPKSPRSHRGIAHDVVEHSPNVGGDKLQALPTRWNENDRSASVELLNGGGEVKFCGLCLYTWFGWACCGEIELLGADGGGI